MKRFIRWIKKSKTHYWSPEVETAAQDAETPCDAQLPHAFCSPSAPVACFLLFLRHGRPWAGTSVSPNFLHTGYNCAFCSVPCVHPAPNNSCPRPGDGGCDFITGSTLLAFFPLTFSTQSLRVILHLELPCHPSLYYLFLFYMVL